MRVLLQQWFARILRHNFSHSVAETHDFMPISIFSFRGCFNFWFTSGPSVISTRPNFGRIVLSRRIWRAPFSATGQMGLFVSTADLNAPSWNGRIPGADVNVPSGNMTTDSPTLQNFRDVVGLTNARVRVAAIKRKVPYPSDERADQGHRSGFTLRHNKYSCWHHGNRREDIQITRMIRRENPRPRRFQILEQIRHPSPSLRYRRNEASRGPLHASRLPRPGDSARAAPQSKAE